MWPFVLLGAALGAVLVLAALARVGAWRWRRLEADLQSRFRQALQSSEAPAGADLAGLDPLPENVRRYLDQVDDGEPAPKTVTLRFDGEFSLRERPPRWRRLRSTQQAGVAVPALHWAGEIAFLPGFAFRVHDAYLPGLGRLHATLGGVLDLARIEAGGMLAEAELLRWLAEAVWYPQALRPRPGLRWQAIDANTARVEVDDGRCRAALVMDFGEDGLVRRIRCPDRPRQQGKGFARLPWEARLGDHQRIDGQLLPAAAEVGWVLDGQYCPYWRADLVSRNAQS